MYSLDIVNVCKYFFSISLNVNICKYLIKSIYLSVNIYLKIYLISIYQSVNFYIQGKKKKSLHKKKSGNKKNRQTVLKIYVKCTYILN